MATALWQWEWQSNGYQQWQGNGNPEIPTEKQCGNLDGNGDTRVVMAMVMSKWYCSNGNGNGNGKGNEEFAMAAAIKGNE